MAVAISGDGLVDRATSKSMFSCLLARAGEQEAIQSVRAVMRNESQGSTRLARLPAFAPIGVKNPVLLYRPTPPASASTKFLRNATLHSTCSSHYPKKRQRVDILTSFSLFSKQLFQSFPPTLTQRRRNDLLTTSSIFYKAALSIIPTYTHTASGVPHMTLRGQNV